jgi:hypothetical protein
MDYVFRNFSLHAGVRMIRPTGVTVIAILCFIGTGLLVIFGILAFFGGAFIGAMLGEAAQTPGRGVGAAGAGFGAMIGGFIGIVFLVIAAVQLTCGIGLWKLKEWGRMLTIVLSAIGAVLAFFSLLHFHPFTMIFVLVRIAVSVLIIWYLSQPQVKAAFVAQPFPPAPAVR